MKAQDLKNSILQLAIQGKLVEQRAEEGTAKELLEKIAAEKIQLIKEKIIKGQKSLPQISEEEIDFDIPESWEWTRLEAVTYSIGNKSNQIKQSEIFQEGQYPVVSQSMNRIEGYSNEENKLLKIKPMSVIVFGDHSKTIKLIDFDFIIGADGTKIMAPISLDPEYLYYVLNYNVINMRDRGYSRHFQFLKEKLIPLPPLEEQKRIVAKIEELMPYVDKYDVAYSEVEKLNKKFPEDMQKSILQYAIQGKLVEQRKEDGTAEELYQQIQKEKKKLIEEGKIKKTKALPEVKEDEIPFDIPENWKWVRITDIFEINPRNNVSDELGVSFIPMALIDDGYVSNFTYEVRPWGDVKKGYTHFQDGDIVMAKITPCFQNLKSALIINLENRIGAGTTELHVLRSHSNISREFFMWFIKSPIFVSTCEKNMTGTAGQKRVPTDVLKEYVVPLPPLEEQKRIVEKIEELLPYAKQLVK